MCSRRNIMRTASIVRASPVICKRQRIAVSTTKLICLLPVRNAEDDLPGYLESVGRFAHAVIALDDGSTDRTREILESSPLVKLVLINPPRPSYVGWDDSANRNRLLAAAADFSPDWI